MSESKNFSPEEKRLREEIFKPEVLQKIKRSMHPIWGDEQERKTALKEAVSMLEGAEVRLREAAKLQVMANQDREAAEALLAEALKAERAQKIETARVIANKDLEIKKWQASAKGNIPIKSLDALERQDKSEQNKVYWKWKYELQECESKVTDLNVRLASAERTNVLLNAELTKAKAITERVSTKTAAETKLRSIISELEQDGLEQDMTIDNLEEENRSLREQIESINRNSRKRGLAFAPLDSAAPASFWIWLKTTKVSGSRTADLGRCFVHGTSPLTEWQMEKLLNQAGCICANAGRGADIVIIGTDGWSKMFLDSLVRGIEKRPRIWTHELTLAALATGDDPLITCPQSILREVGKMHPAIAYLMTLGFEWPFLPEEQESDVLMVGSFSADQSPLTVMGYHVGREHRSASARRSHLTKIYTNRLAFSADYPRERKLEWGDRGAPQRLQQIALQITRNIGRNRGRDGLGLACKHWEQDLDWLKDKYYNGKADFVWPG